MAQDPIQPLLDAVPIPAIFVGTDARMRGANARALALNPNAGDQRTFVLIFRQPSLTSAIENCLRTRTAQKAIYLHSDGPQEVRFDVSCSYVACDEFEGVMACFQDVTELQQAGERRREFVANVSHELRTPLTALLGFIETLRGPARDDAEARDRFLATMSDEASRMNRLVGDLLSLSRVEEDARMRPGEWVDVPGLIGTAIRNLTPLAEERGAKLVFQPPGKPMTAPADSDQLLQVFTNLIENALKYGGRGGGVTITLSEVERDLHLRQPALRIDVADEGAGIDPTHIPRLTERFYRIDSHRSREMGGTGLGLAIVKHIVNRHRGRLKIESEPGQGSVFSVILPKQ